MFDIAADWAFHGRLPPMSVLVTGGAGFIGSNLVRRLLRDGHDVIVLDDLSTGNLRNIVGLDVEHIDSSVLNTAAVKAAVARVDSVVHLAALGSVPRSIANPLATHKANVDGTLCVLEAARETGTHVVISSSSSVYGSVPNLPRVESLATRPMSPYAASKLAAESYVLAFGASYGLPTLPFRFFNVYGPRQAAGHAYAAVIPVFIDAALRQIALPLEGDGRQSRDFTYVDTVTWVLADAVRRRVTSEVPVNLALGSNLTLLDVINELEILMDRPLPISNLPARVGDVRMSHCSPELLMELFPKIPTTEFPEGLARTLEWSISELRIAK